MSIPSTTLHGAIPTTHGTIGTGRYATTPSTTIGIGVATTIHTITTITTILAITLRHPHQDTIQDTTQDTIQHQVTATMDVPLVQVI